MMPNPPLPVGTRVAFNAASDGTYDGATGIVTAIDGNYLTISRDGTLVEYQRHVSYCRVWYGK